MRETPLVYTDIVFNAKPDAVPYNYRISYKVTQLCLIMRICGRGDVCSLIKLHMISFALISQENMRKLVDFADGIGSAPIVRFDPSVNRALTNELCHQRRRRLRADQIRLGACAVYQPFSQRYRPLPLDDDAPRRGCVRQRKRILKEAIYEK